MCTLNTFML